VSARQRFRDRVLESLAWRLGLRVLLVMSRDMARSGPPQERGLELRLLDGPQVLALAADPALDLREAWAREVIELPGGCSAAFRDGVPVAYAWFALQCAPDRDGLWVRVPTRCAYRYKAFVRPEFRNQGIVRQLNRFNDRLCIERGCDRAVSLVAAQNAPSLASAKGIGTRPVGVIFSWRLLGRTLVVHSPGARRLGLRLTHEAPVADPRDALFTRQ
jgi:GNAT superfamily N-acetyltransferase